MSPDAALPAEILTFPLLERLACLCMRGRLIISRFAVLTGLSPKTLRYYDEIDLLCPADVDDLNSYRYYSVTQIDLAVRIRRWRELGLPLDEIRYLIDHPDHVKEVFFRHEKRLSAEIEERQQLTA